MKEKRDNKSGRNLKGTSGKEVEMVWACHAKIGRPQLKWKYKGGGREEGLEEKVVG